MPLETVEPAVPAAAVAAPIAPIALSAADARGIGTAHAQLAAHDHRLAATEDASYRLSAFATWTVSACAVHCVVTPFVAGVLPLVGIGVLASPWVEWSVVAFAAVVGGAGMWLSYSRVHRTSAPALVFLVGLTMLVLTHVLLEGRLVLHGVSVFAAAAVIFAAGRMNHARVHACEACHPHPHA